MGPFRRQSECLWSNSRLVSLHRRLDLSSKPDQRKKFYFEIAPQGKRAAAPIWSTSLAFQFEEEFWLGLMEDTWNHNRTRRWAPNTKANKREREGEREGGRERGKLREVLLTPSGDSPSHLLVCVHECMLGWSNSFFTMKTAHMSKVGNKQQWQKKKKNVEKPECVPMVSRRAECMSQFLHTHPAAKTWWTWLQVQSLPGKQPTLLRPAGWQ